MTRRPLAWAVLAGAALWAAPPAAAQSGNAVVGRSSRVYQALESLHADFEQVIDDQMLGRFDSRGRLVQAGSAHLSMRFTDPDGDAIVADGRHIWVYTPSTTEGQVLRFRLPSTPVYGMNILSWLLDRPTERYRATLLRTERLADRPVDVVELVPLVPELPFSRAVVWLDQADALPRRLEVRERGGALRTITLTRVRTNLAVPPGSFTFTVPKGVRIIEQS